MIEPISSKCRARFFQVPGIYWFEAHGLKQTSTVRLPAAERMPDPLGLFLFANFPSSSCRSSGRGNRIHNAADFLGTIARCLQKRGVVRISKCAFSLGCPDLSPLFLYRRGSGPRRGFAWGRDPTRRDVLVRSAFQASIIDFTGYGPILRFNCGLCRAIHGLRIQHIVAAPWRRVLSK